MILESSVIKNIHYEPILATASKQQEVQLSEDKRKRKKKL